MQANLHSVLSKLRNLYSGAHNNASIFLVKIGTVILVGTVVVIFMARTLSQKTHNIQEGRAAITQYQDRIDSLNQIKQEYKQIEPEFPKLYSLLVYSENLGDAITILDELSDSFALQSSIKIGTKIENPEGNAFQLTISAKTSLDTLKRYIKKLEKLPFLITVQSIKFSGDTLRPGDVVITMNLYVHS